MFTETVEVGIIREPSAQIQVLRLKDDIRTSSVKEDFISAQDSKREGILLVVEAESRLFLVNAFLSGRAENDRFRNLVDLLIGIIDHNMEAVL
jgi:hypothetical protein